MRTRQRLVAIGMFCLVALAAAPSAFAALKIDLVHIDNELPPKPGIIEGGGQLQEIMQVAAEAWERVFKRGGGNWKLTIEYGWSALRDPSLFAQHQMATEGGNPSRINRSCIRFNNSPGLQAPVEGFFADPTPRDNSEYLSYTAITANMGDGWLNAGRVFSEPTGDAIGRVDLLQIAMHEIGHALGIDDHYSGFAAQFKENLLIHMTPPRPFAGFIFSMNPAGPHIGSFAPTPLMTIHPVAGWRQLISGADALLIAQVSSFDRPDLSEPSLEENGEGRGVAMGSSSSSFSCNGQTGNY